MPQRFPPNTGQVLHGQQANRMSPFANQQWNSRTNQTIMAGGAMAQV